MVRASWNGVLSDILLFLEKVKPSAQHGMLCYPVLLTHPPYEINVFFFEVIMMLLDVPIVPRWGQDKAES